MKPSVSVVVPAWNEEDRIGATLEALHRMRDETNKRPWDELIVVDDGSTDRTAEVAARWATIVVEHDRKRGKGTALHTGWTRAGGDIVLFADADLEHSAVHLTGLLAPVRSGKSDMAIAVFSVPASRGGFGIVKRLAGHGIYRLTGVRCEAPLSGQRAVRKEVLEAVGRPAGGFGIEVGLTIDAARLGFSICEVPLPLRHRETGRTWHGFVHRGVQMMDVARTLFAKRRRSLR